MFGYSFFVVAVILVSAWQGMNQRDIQIFIGLLWIAYFVARLMANLLFDADSKNYAKQNSRRNFGRGYFALWRDKDGNLRVETDGDNRDHSQRCIDSLNESYVEEKYARWNNWFYIVAIFALALFIDFV